MILYLQKARAPSFLLDKSAHSLFRKIQHNVHSEDV